MFTKYGYFTIGTVVIVSSILFTLGILLNSTPYKILLIIAILILAFTLNFFRDPERKPPKADNVLVSPADGTVLFVKEIKADCFIDGNAIQISIFMSPFNVHVNRIPINGKIEYLKYHKGDYLIASDDKASSRNERNEIGMTSRFGKILFTQVAGFVARRIVCDLKINQEVQIGDRFGMIKFGSRVDIIVPCDWKSKVKKDDNVYAGETIIFEHITKVNQ
jgi:phosphatidylserine decarboxylase